MKKKGVRLYQPDKIHSEALLKLIAEKPLTIKDIIHKIRIKCTEVEIANSYLVSHDTIQRFVKESIGITFAQLKELCCEDYNIRLREHQLALSKKSSAMAIRLGELWLGQAETPTAGAKPLDLSDVILGVEIGAICQK